MHTVVARVDDEVLKEGIVVDANALTIHMCWQIMASPISCILQDERAHRIHVLTTGAAALRGTERALKRIGHRILLRASRACRRTRGLVVHMPFVLSRWTQNTGQLVRVLRLEARLSFPANRALASHGAIRTVRLDEVVDAVAG